MGDKVLPRSLFSCLYGPAFTYLCIISHRCSASKSNFKENLCTQDILIHKKASNLVNEVLLTHKTKVIKCGTIWNRYNYDLIRSALIDQKFLNYWHVRTVNCSSSSGEKDFLILSIHFLIIIYSYQAKT